MAIFPPLIPEEPLSVNGRNNMHEVQGPVVQSIVSLTSSLRRQLVKYMPTTNQNPLLFFVGKCENLLHKILTFFQQKSCVFVIFML